MAVILSNNAVMKIRKLNKEFEKFSDKGWMCEGGEYGDKPCNNIFNNDTDEFIKADFNGKLLNTRLSHTAMKDAEEIARIQGEIARVVENG